MNIAAVQFESREDADRWSMKSMKAGCKTRRIVGWRMLGRMVAGVLALLWFARWFVRLMPRAVGGEGVYAWSELADRTYRVVDRWDR